VISEIAGTGVDIVSVARLRSAIERQGEPLLKRLFTGAELAEVSSDARCWERYASRFAAKEAVMKCLGAGLWQVGFHEIEIVSDGQSRPSVVLHGRALLAARAAGIAKVHISMSHEKEFATGFAIAVAGEVE
jgi:holo-[acyl-carrier protein] synthase